MEKFKQRLGDLKYMNNFCVLITLINFRVLITLNKFPCFDYFKYITNVI